MAVKKTVKKKAEKTKKSIDISQEDFEDRVVELAGKGLTSEKIGESLRKEGVHPKNHGKRISAILTEKGVYTNPDLKNIEDRLKKISAHYDKNRQDKRAMRDKERIFSQLRKTKKYLKIEQER